MWISSYKENKLNFNYAYLSSMESVKGEVQMHSALLILLLTSFSSTWVPKVFTWYVLSFCLLLFLYSSCHVLSNLMYFVAGETCQENPTCRWTTPQFWTGTSATSSFSCREFQLILYVLILVWFISSDNRWETS